MIQDTGGRKTLLATRTNKVMTMPRTIPIVETKMEKWTRLRMTMRVICGREKTMIKR